MINSIYANARAVTATRSLLGSDRLNRMADCASAQDALKILSEVNFGDGKIVESPLDYEELVAAEETKLISFIKEVSPSEKLSKFLLCGNDYHNAEAVMRAKYLKIDFTPMLTTEGFLSAEILKERIFSDDYAGFPQTLSRALLEADNLFVSGNADGRSVSTVFRRALYEEFFSLAESDKLLKEIYRAKADAANVAVALRSRNTADAKAQYVPGGTLSEEQLEVLCTESSETIKEKFRYAKTKDLVYAADGFTEGRPLTDFERLADGYALKFLKKEKYNDEGFRPFILYCYYKFAELSNVRIVMSCLNNGVTGTAVRERLRETYEG